MPVKNNITGVWRHLRLSSLPDTVLTGVSTVGSVCGTGANATKSLNDIYLIVENANFQTQQSVSAAKLLQGTAKTKVVEIGEASDTLSISGPMLFADKDTSAVSTNPYLLMQATSNNYGDASNVVAAYLADALNYNPSTVKSSYAKSIKITIDDGGFKWDLSLQGDPTSLYPSFYSPASSTLPFGYYTGQSSGPPQLGHALRKAAWYDFYVNIEIEPIIGVSGYNVTLGNTKLAAAIQSFSMDINISADPFKLLGRGQAPWWAIGAVEMKGSFTVVFPLLDALAGGGYPTVVPTWQAVPEPWKDKAADPSGSGQGVRLIDSSGTLIPTPSGQFPDAPDIFTLTKVDPIPKYVLNGAPVIDSATIHNTDIPIVIESSSVTVNAGIIRAEASYSVVFND